MKVLQRMQVRGRCLTEQFEQRRLAFLVGKREEQDLQRLLKSRARSAELAAVTARLALPMERRELDFRGDEVSVSGRLYFRISALARGMSQM